MRTTDWYDLSTNERDERIDDPCLDDDGDDDNRCPTYECDNPASSDGGPCAECHATEAEWRREWERSGRHEMRYLADDIRDAYSEPSERAKRDRLLREVE